MTKISANTCDGKVVSITGDKLETTCGVGKQHCHTLAKGAKVTCDGKPGKVTDLKAGTQVKITTDKDDKTVAMHIECGKQISPVAGKA